MSIECILIIPETPSLDRDHPIPHGKEWAVCILLECILVLGYVYLNTGLNSVPVFTKICNLVSGIGISMELGTIYYEL